MTTSGAGGARTTASASGSRLCTLAAVVCLSGPGCVFLYGSAVPAPGLSVPPTEDHSGDISLSLGVAPNASSGVEVDVEGNTLGTDDRIPFWPYLDLGWRQSLTQGVGIEVRGVASLLLPFPFPVPNGVSAAPVFRIAELGRDSRLDVSPRFVLTSSRVTVVDLDNNESTLRTRGYGVELPLYFVWEASDAVTLNATPYGRAFLNNGRLYENDVPGDAGAWWVPSGGLTANALVTGGWFRFGIGGGVEVVPDPAAGMDCIECTERPAIVLAPQGSISIGGAWR